MKNEKQHFLILGSTASPYKEKLYCKDGKFRLHFSFGTQRNSVKFYKKFGNIQRLQDKLMDEEGIETTIFYLRGKEILDANGNITTKV